MKKGIIHGTFKLEMNLGLSVTSSGEPDGERWEGDGEPLLCLGLLSLPMGRARVHHCLFGLRLLV